MKYPAATYTNFKVENKEKKIKVMATLIYQDLEKTGIVVMYLIGPVLIYYINFGTNPMAPFMKVVAMVVAALWARKILKNLLRLPIIIFDKSKATLSELGLDKFEEKLSNIRQLKVIEETYSFEKGGTKLYRIQYQLADGERTSGFAFTSFNTAEELIKVIKSTAEELE